MTRRALAVGEVLIDEYPDRRVVAGAPLHVLAHLAALGWNTALITRVGDDVDGRTIVDVVREAGVSTHLVEIDGHLPTGTTTIKMPADGGHTFTVHHPAAWDAVEGPHPVPAHDVLIFGTLAQRDPRGRATVERLAASPGLRVADLNLRAPHYDAASVRWTLEHADVVKATAEEESSALGLLGIASLGDRGARWVAITRGAEGASLYASTGETWEATPSPVAVVDSVGAGDAFLAGLIDGLVPDGDPEAALRQAVRLAVDTLGHRGGMPVPPVKGT